MKERVVARSDAPTRTSQYREEDSQGMGSEGWDHGGGRRDEETKETAETILWMQFVK